MKVIVILTVALTGLAVHLSPAYADATVDQQDRQFSQPELAVHAGDRVTFTNSDKVTHDISVRDPAGTRISSTMQKPGETAAVTFAQPGEYHVECLIHPKMKMTVRAE